MELPDNITAIETEAFAYCPSLSNVLIPHKVTKLGNACFYGCTGLSQIIIPASVEEMGNNVFYGCKNLKDVKVMPVIPPQIHEGTFANTSSELKIYCLADSLDVYKTELFWKEYANKIVTL